MEFIHSPAVAFPSPLFVTAKPQEIEANYVQKQKKSANERSSAKKVYQADSWHVGAGILFKA